jgi:hypothetical protein
VTILVPPNACLRVLDPVFSGGETYDRYPRFLRDAIPLSDPGLIITDAVPAQLPPSIFRREPPRSWCYYYEKAELARQVGDWETIVELGDEARSRGFAPGDALEWLPFIEAYVRSGDVQKARDLSITAFQDDSRPRKGLCYTWKRIQSERPDLEEVQIVAAELREEFVCPP